MSGTLNPPEIFSISEKEKTIFAESIPRIMTERMKGDTNWVLSNPLLLKSYEGEWIAVFNKEIIAHGKNSDMVEKEAITKTGEEEPGPFLHFVENSMAFY